MFNKDVLKIITSIVYKSKIKRVNDQYHSIFCFNFNDRILIRESGSVVFNYRYLDYTKTIWKLRFSTMQNIYYMSSTNYHINKNYTL